MRFFKYLILLIFFTSTSSYAGFYVLSYKSQTLSSTKDEACSKLSSLFNSTLGGDYSYSVNKTTPFCQIKRSDGGLINGDYSEAPIECFYPDYKIVQQPLSSLKSTICLPINGAMCKYVGNPTGSPVVNGGITTNFSSVSKTPDPTCKEELVNPPCDPTDPYGGCFTPPDDNCTRQFNGSIVCPPDVEPKVQKGCANGATYCDRPPQGCGEGYVSGSFNGKALCVKTSPSNGSGTGTGDGGGDGDGGTGSNTTDGTGTSTSTGTNTSTTTNSDGSSTTTNTTTNNTTVNNFKIDFSPVVNAVKQVSSDIKNLKNELLTSLTDLTNKLGITNSKIDQTNSKLDASNTNLTSIKDSSLRQEELLKAIRDKSGSDSASGASVDLTETNGLLGEIRDAINSIKDVFSDEGKAELEQIGQASNDSRYLNAQGNAQSSLNNLANKLTFGSSACLSDFQIQLPIFGSVNIALSQWCPLLALLKILLNLIVLLTCLRMLDATVRTI